MCSKHLFFSPPLSASAKRLWQKWKAQIAWLALGANPNCDCAPCLCYGSLFTRWWESQTPSQLWRFFGRTESVSVPRREDFFFLSLDSKKSNPEDEQQPNKLLLSTLTALALTEVLFSPESRPASVRVFVRGVNSVSETQPASRSRRHNTHSHLGLAPPQSGTIR